MQRYICTDINAIFPHINVKRNIEFGLRKEKLTKEEWDALEVPIHKEEQIILKMIIDGFDDVNIVENETMSIMNYMKISENIDFYMDWLFKQYFMDIVKSLAKKYDYTFISNYIILCKSCAFLEFLHDFHR